MSSLTSFRLDDFLQVLLRRRCPDGKISKYIRQAILRSLYLDDVLSRTNPEEYLRVSSTLSDFALIEQVLYDDYIGSFPLSDEDKQTFMSQHVKIFRESKPT